MNIFEQLWTGNAENRNSIFVNPQYQELADDLSAKEETVRNFLNPSDLVFLDEYKNSYLELMSFCEATAFKKGFELCAKIAKELK